MQPTTRFWMLGLGLLAIVCAIITMLGPVQITIALDPATPKAAAQGNVVRDLPTTTPPPPTQVPQAQPTPQPTAAPTDVPPTAIPPTAPPPERRERRSTPTPTEIPTAPPPATAVPAPEIRITKRANVQAVLPGEQISYSLTVENIGRGVAHDVVVTDAVPAALKVVDLKSSKGDIVAKDGQVMAYPRELAPDETQTYTIVAQVLANTPAGEIANTAVVTTSSSGDEPGNNTSTATITVQAREAVPTPQASTPPRLPTTADPNVQENFLAIYWPLLALVVGLFGFAAAARLGVFRQRTLRVTVGTAHSGQAASVAPPAAVGPQQTADLVLNTEDLIARWRSGASVPILVDLVAQHNPQADRLTISLAVQRVLDAAVE